MQRNTTALLLVSFLLLPSATLASSGDRAPVFQTCVSDCEQQICSSPNVTLQLALRLTRWTCADECRYSCMHTITDHAVSTHGSLQQYYGKWPFWRFAGMQEPVSVLFSVLNLLGHVQGLSTANRVIPSAHPMRPYYLGWGIINVNAWIWSAVFHTRGTATFHSHWHIFDLSGRHFGNRTARLLFGGTSDSLFLILHRHSALSFIRAAAATSCYTPIFNPKVSFTHLMERDMSDQLSPSCLLPNTPISI